MKFIPLTKLRGLKHIVGARIVTTDNIYVILTPINHTELILHKTFSLTGCTSITVSL